MILVLAGSGEGRELCRLLAASGVKAIASLAGVTKDPARLAIETISGGFGGDEGFRRFLRTREITAVVDATHPFAARITDRTARICKEENVALLQILRPAWTSGEGDDWVMIDDEADAALHIPEGAHVFIGTGRGTLHRFENLPGRILTCRQIDAPEGPFPFANGQYLIGRPPFSVEDEYALFSRLKIDWLVVKNAGGVPSRTKLDAARQLGIRVAMVRRPARPDTAMVETAAAALDWVVEQ
ncbi:cobalt-precorrin-6A reductase [Candidatus Halocynthiibacter alkanivorans]|jgi:precorrin-6A/cobalt-precorrin-6A reductase|uniref:cobalt-precorrin-6A reductase n=1 Tax=Candidatus Halocynthiibacter alkanivorans TaxID=2267619 RepID=UPI000DF2612D|nr:cobalt-precorrin-6A reductase [Candidatus Halocynthiibacter alkanivorans]